MLSRWGALAHGVGDDAALLDVPAGSRLAVSTDTSVENVHFRRELAFRRRDRLPLGGGGAQRPRRDGRHAARRRHRAHAHDTWREQISQLADGFASAARELGAPIVGGDLSAGSELAIAVTVLGAVERPLVRSGARAGDALWVTGRLGGPLLALRAMQEGRAPLAAHRDRFARPVPRLREARWLAAHGATAAIDCSDGIAADAGHLAAASGARIVLDLDRLPFMPGVSTRDAAQSGEEYELVVTAPVELDRRAFEREFGVPLTAVGRVEEAGALGAGVQALERGHPVPLPRGHSHFSG